MATLCAAVAMYAASAASAGPPVPCYPPESAPLVATVPELIGEPLEPEHPAPDDPGALVQRTTTGLLYRSPDRPPTFTNGWARARLEASGELVGWAGPELDPPPPASDPAAAPAAPSIVHPPVGGSSARGGFSQPAAGPAPQPVGVWDRLAQCESGQTWTANTGNGYYGGLQEDLTFWRNHGGLAYASRPDRASRAAQIAVAINGRDGLVGKAQGWGAWPVCSRRLGLLR